jgi:hypothetical protein
MNRIGLIMALAILSGTGAYAQQIQWVDPAVPRAMPDSSVEPSGKLADPAIPQLVMDPRRGHTDADARQCLQLATNDQIHRCAEEYRPHASHAKVVKTGQAAGKAKPGDAPKAPDTATPESPKAAEASKATDTTKAAAPAKSADARAPKSAAASKTAEPAKSADSAKPPAAAKPADASKPAK